MVNLGNTWSTNVLGEDGGVYNWMRLTSPVIPLGVLLFNWYIFSEEGLPLPIIVVVIFVSLVFLYQCYEAFKLIKIASNTVKSIYFYGEDKISIILFSKKKVTIDAGCFVFLKDLNKNIIPFNQRLFPKGKTHGVLKVDDKSYFLSRTIDNAEEVFDLVDQLSA